jgi:hypothetical protein
MKGAVAKNSAKSFLVAVGKRIKKRKIDLVILEVYFKISIMTNFRKNF